VKDTGLESPVNPQVGKPAPPGFALGAVLVVLSHCARVLTQKSAKTRKKKPEKPVFARSGELNGDTPWWNRLE